MKPCATDQVIESLNHVGWKRPSGLSGFPLELLLAFAFVLAFAASFLICSYTKTFYTTNIWTSLSHPLRHVPTFCTLHACNMMRNLNLGSNTVDTYLAT